MFGVTMSIIFTLVPILVFAGGLYLINRNTEKSQTMFEALSDLYNLEGNYPEVELAYGSVEAVQVTEENFFLVVDWVDGFGVEIEMPEGPHDFIGTFTENGVLYSFYPGAWVFWSDDAQGFRAFEEEALFNMFTKTHPESYSIQVQIIND